MEKATHCRLCGEILSSTVIEFQDQFVSNFVHQSSIEHGVKVPIDLVICESCTMVQQVYSAPQEILYSQNYWYRSGVTDTMRQQLSDIVDACFDELQINKDDIMLDIGANDGTMLHYAKEKCLTVGIDPAKNLFSQLKENCDFASNDFWSASAYQALARKHDLGRPKVVTAIGMFYDLEDPMSFVRDIADIMHDDGIFVAQLMTLEPMLEKNDLGNLCHEHLEFYTYSSLVYLFENSGLEIYKVTENNTNGGSYRIFARKYKSGSISYNQKIDYHLIEEFKARVDKIGSELNALIEEINTRGETIHVLGASTKGNCILQYFGIDSEKIKFASERSPEKYGLYTIGTGIKILSEEDSRSLKPNYYLILPWAFKDEIIARESNHVARGGKFILPFPNLKVI